MSLTCLGCTVVCSFVSRQTLLKPVMCSQSIVLDETNIFNKNDNRQLGSCFVIFNAANSISLASFQFLRFVKTVKSVSLFRIFIQVESVSGIIVIINIYRHRTTYTIMTVHTFATLEWQKANPRTHFARLPPYNGEKSIKTGPCKGLVHYLNITPLNKQCLHTRSKFYKLVL